MKKVLLATTAILAVSGVSASAADLPMKAARPMVDVAPSWAGSFIGAHLGVGRMDASTAVQSSTSSNIFSSGCSYGASCSSAATGVVGGVEIGHDWQKGSFVYGVAADWTWTDLDKTRSGSTSSSNNASGYSLKHQVDWLATFRGRMGLAVQDTLVYVTGGLALGRVGADYRATWASNPPSVYSDMKKTRVGWVAGGGIEHRFDRKWSFKAEALYYDLGSFNTSSVCNSSAGCDATYTSNHHFSVIVGRVGVNYRF